VLSGVCVGVVCVSVGLRQLGSCWVDASGLALVPGSLVSARVVSRLQMCRIIVDKVRVGCERVTKAGGVHVGGLMVG
jgi:hypothetical protein